MAFDLWEGGQYTYVCVGCVDGVCHHGLVARKLGAKIGIAE
jgi:hypothetical protein